jgi:hypothetical protein
MMVMGVCGGDLLDRAGDSRSRMRDNASHYRCEAALTQTPEWQALPEAGYGASQALGSKSDRMG